MTAGLRLVAKDPGHFVQGINDRLRLLKWDLGKLSSLLVLRI